MPSDITVEVSPALRDYDPTRDLNVEFTMTAPFPADPGVSEEKTVSFTNTNLLVNSSDVFRNAVGGFYFNDTDSENNFRTPPSFYKFLPLNNPNNYIFSVSSYKGRSIDIPISAGTSQFISTFTAVGGSLTADPTLDETVGGLGGDTANFYADQTATSFLDTILPFVQFVVHVEGDPINEILENPMQGNKFWKLMFTGDGEFNEIPVNSIYNERVYSDHSFATTLPYDKMQKQFHYKKDNKKYLECSYEYNRFFRQYQEYNSLIDSELLIPNWYMMGLLPYAGDYLTPGFVPGFRSTEYIPTETLKYYSFGKDAAEDAEQFSLNIYDKLTFDQAFKARSRIGSVMSYGPAPGDTRAAAYRQLREHLNYHYVISASIAPEKTKDFHKTHHKNIIFNNISARETLQFNEVPFTARRLWPYYSQIKFNKLPSGDYTDLLVTEHCDTIFMRSLKEIFNNQAPDTPVSMCQFLRNERFVDPAGDVNREYGTPMVENVASKSQIVNYRSVDFVKLMLHAHNSIKDVNHDFTIVDFRSVDVQAAYYNKGVFRAYNVKNVLKYLTRIQQLFYDESGKTAFKINNINSLLNSQKDQIQFDHTQFNLLEPQSKDHEVVAYRVEKIAGPGTGDSNTQNVIQNYWIFNGTENIDFNLIDSQVKYDSDYTYNIYAYKLVSGYTYRFSNLQLSRVISFVSQEADDSDTSAYEALIAEGPGIDETQAEFLSRVKAYCIEFYDPFTGDTVKDLLENVVYHPELPSTIDVSSLAGEDVRVAISQRSYSPVGRSEVASSSPGAPETAALPPYIANFVATIQPSLKLIECPLMSKTFKIMDNPPNEVNVIPNVTLQGSNANAFVFDLVYQNFDHRSTYPKIVSPSSDLSKRESYLHGRDILNTSKLIDGFSADEPDRASSISPIREIEVYRMDTKPLTFADFEGSLVAKIPMMLSAEESRFLDNPEFSYTTEYFSDKIVSNKKYYYLFRAVNENGMPGKVDIITEAELVDDGGYRYALFNTLFEQDLIVDKTDRTSTKFKKLIQLTPNFSQMNLDVTNTTYLQNAEDAYDSIPIGDAEEKIWDKTFKLRLTSKKTGKKIDLNITYTDPEQRIRTDAAMESYITMLDDDLPYYPG